MPYKTTEFQEVCKSTLVWVSFSAIKMQIELQQNNTVPLILLDNTETLFCSCIIAGILSMC